MPSSTSANLTIKQMKTEEIELMITVLKGNIAGLEMIESSAYVELEQTEYFEQYTERKLTLVVQDLQDIVNALHSVLEDRKNPQQDIMSAVNDAIGLPGFNF